MGRPDLTAWMGRVWKGMAGCGRVWQTVAGFGRLWQGMADWGQIWRDAAKEGMAVESMEVRLQSGKLIIVDADRLGEIWKLRGFLTEDEMAQVEAAVKSYGQNFSTCG